MNVRVTAVLLAILGVVSAYLIFVGPPGSGEPARAPSPWFYSASMDDVEAIRIASTGVEESFVRSEDGWVFVGPERIPVDLDRWGGVTLLLSGPQSTRVFADGVDDVAKYGLDEPETVINARLRGDREIEIRLGDLTPNGFQHYAMQGNDPALYLVDSLWGEVLVKLATDPPFPKWLYRTEPDLVRFLEITRGDDTVQFTKDVTEVGGWRFSGKDRSPVDPERWGREILPILGGPPNIRILQASIDTADFPRLGLQDPVTVMHVEYNPPGTIEALRRVFDMEIGAKTEDGTGYNAKVVGYPYLIFVDADWYETMEQLVLDPPYSDGGPAA